MCEKELLRTRAKNFYARLRKIFRIRVRKNFSHALRTIFYSLLCLKHPFYARVRCVKRFYLRTRAQKRILRTAFVRKTTILRTLVNKCFIHITLYRFLAYKPL